MKHDLKIAPQYFDAVADGSKPFEVWFNDRNYKVGDVLMLREYVEQQGHYTGRWLERLVTYVLDNKNFCKEDLVILGLSESTARPPSPTLDIVTRQFEDAQAKNVRRRLLIEEVINLCAIGDIDEKTDDGIGWGSWVARAKVEVAR